MEIPKSSSVVIPGRDGETFRDLSTTPGGTIYGTTPGGKFNFHLSNDHFLQLKQKNNQNTKGTKIQYSKEALLFLRNSPLSKTPPCNMPFIPGITVGSGNQNQFQNKKNNFQKSPNNNPQSKKPNTPPNHHSNNNNQKPKPQKTEEVPAIKNNPVSDDKPDSDDGMSFTITSQLFILFLLIPKKKHKCAQNRKRFCYGLIVIYAIRTIEISSD